MPPRGKHLFGTVTVGERWQIVIPKQARELFGIEAGDALLVLGDEEQGLALLTEERALMILHQIQMVQQEAKKDEGR